MNDISTDIQVWFLRHGKPRFNYKTNNYDDFMEMLCNGFKKSLVVNPRVDFESLPKRVDFVGYSSFTRASETAELLCSKLDVKHMEEMPSLDEVRFDKNIISKNEFENLEQIRPEILTRWYNNENKAESFKDSLMRVKKIESFLTERQEKTIILITHGWFLRLLELYIVQGNHTPTLSDLLNTKPVSLGHCIKATVAHKYSIESRDISNSFSAQSSKLGMRITY